MLGIIISRVKSLTNLNLTQFVSMGLSVLILLLIVVQCTWAGNAMATMTGKLISVENKMVIFSTSNSFLGDFETGCEIISSTKLRGFSEVEQLSSFIGKQFNFSLGQMDNYVDPEKTICGYIELDQN